MWTWDEIKREWLGSGRIALSPHEAVAAFNRVQADLGGDWMTACRGSSGETRGTGPTLTVINMGQRLAILDGISSTNNLLRKLRDGDYSASAELTAIYLVKSGRADVAIELEPDVTVGDRNKRPDFRVAVPNCTPTCVEVTQPSLSEDQEEAQRILHRLSSGVAEIKHGFALEVFLRRVPSDVEVEAILDRLPSFCTLDGDRRQELGELGFLQLNLDSPGRLELRSYGEERLSRICVVKAICGPNEPHRHIAVRLAFSDERARQFLKAKAKQLPKDAPGLIMIQTAHAPGAVKNWEPLLRRRLQANLHTRVSAICLFNSGFEGTSDGEAWIPRTKLILNPHAQHVLPDWIAQQLARFASDY
jgi:hypothetical protein